MFTESAGFVECSFVVQTFEAFSTMHHHHLEGFKPP